MYNRPKMPRVRILKNDARERLVVVSLPVTHEHQFISYCKAAVVMGSCGDMGEEVCLGTVVTRNNVQIVDGEIPIKSYLPKHSVWDISWCMLIDQGDGVLRDSPYSSAARVDLRSKEQFAILDNVSKFNEIAKRRTDGLRSTVRSHPGRHGLNRDEIETRYWMLHREITKGRSVEMRMRGLLKQAGEASSQELMSLHEILEEAAAQKNELEKLCEGYIRRDSRRSFKAKVAEFLESGVGPKWIENATKEELEELGGEPNRLYQLLIEGRKANSLLMDGTMLLAAAKRDDFFSTKQRDTLKQKGNELEKQSHAEAERANEEAKKQEEGRKELTKMQEMAEKMPERGTMVRIHGLVAHKELNDSLAWYMGIAPDSKRYILRLCKDDREIALRENNFSQWDDSPIAVANFLRGTEIGSESSHEGETAANGYHISSPNHVPMDIPSRKDTPVKNEPAVKVPAATQEVETQINGGSHFGIARSQVIPSLTDCLKPSKPVSSNSTFDHDSKPSKPHITPVTNAGSPRTVGMQHSPNQRTVRNQSPAQPPTSPVRNKQKKKHRCRWGLKCGYLKRVRTRFCTVLPVYFSGHKILTD